MTNIIETKFGTLVSPNKIAYGSASSIKKSGAFYNFSIRISNDDVREYSFAVMSKPSLSCSTKYKLVSPPAFVAEIRKDAASPA